MEFDLKSQFLKMSLNITKSKLAPRVLCPSLNLENLQSTFYAFLTLTSVLFYLCIGTLEAATREYWIAAEKVEWNYAPSGQNLIRPAMGLDVWGKALVYEKYRYIQYTDNTLRHTGRTTRLDGHSRTATARCRRR